MLGQASRIGSASALCAALLGIFAVPPSVAGATSAASYVGSAEVAVRANPAAPLAAAPLLAAPRRSRAPRRAGLHAAASSVLAPPAATPTAIGRALTAPLENFNGTSSRDSAVTNFGAEFEPPDQGLCAGNGFVVDMVNSAYTVYDTSGKTLAGPFNVNDPFDEGALEFTSDPRCYYDASDHTWFAIVLQIGKEETSSELLLAVNSSGDPRKAWTTYKINTTDLGGKTGPKEKECPCFGDQPKLGVDGQNLYVTADVFSITGLQYNGDQIFAFSKKQLAELAPTVDFALYRKLSIGGAPAVAVQPALTTGAAGSEFFLNSIDPNETFDQRIGVWALSDPALVSKGGVPPLSSLVLGSEAFGVPPGSEQKGTESLIASGDDRMQQVQSIGGSIWGELTTAVTVPGDPVQRAAGAWFQVKATVSGGSLASASIHRQGYVAVAGNYVVYPALQVTKAGSAAMVFTLTGAGRHPSAAFGTMEAGASAFGPVSVAAPGVGVYDPSAERWGDYSWAVLDPSLESVWMATEYVPPKASQTPDGLHNWGTRVLEVSP